MPRDNKKPAKSDAVLNETGVYGRAAKTRKS